MKLIKTLELTVKHLGVLCIALLFFLMILQVLLRYGFGYTHFLTEELGRYLLVWATLAGMAIETLRSGHIRVSFLLEKLPPTIARPWQLLIDIIVLLLFLLLIYTGIDSMIFNHGQESSGLQIPLSISFSCVPIFFFIAAIFLGEKIRKQFRDKI
jgi:TRAP-type C4-dicarboxylate transport system permease small subunit